MQQLQDHLKGADLITKMNSNAAIHVIQNLLGHKKHTAFRTKLGLV
jgi:hypothetical protein